MSVTNDPRSKGQPALSDLMAKYLQRQTEAHAAGFAAFTGEVQPYEAGPVQPIDAKPAWEAALTVMTFSDSEAEPENCQAPPSWPTLVAGHPPAFDLAMALCNFPQLVRNLQPLLSAENLVELRQSADGRPINTPALVEWVEKIAAQQQFPQLLLAIGALRLAKQYDMASQLVAENETAIPSEWKSLWENEKAALTWHRGDSDEARQMWRSQPESTPVVFNRGMAALFVNDLTEARENLNKAVAQLPESSTWHHLARLYLTLAETR